ncbi:MAG: ATP-binding protein [Acidimicrobiales bacterium]
MATPGFRLRLGLPPRLAAARRPPLVGRRIELEVLERSWADVLEGQRQLTFLGGEPGAGKSRLLAEVAGAVHDQGATVLAGTSSVDAGIPYQPFAEMLDHLFATAPEGSLASTIERSDTELGRLSARVVRHSPRGDGRDPPDGVARLDLFDAVAALFRSLTRERPLALVLDDLQWAKLPTLALLKHVVERCPDTRMLVLAAFRTTAPDRSEELATQVADLHRLDGVRRLDLGGLDTDAIAEYVSLRSGLTVRAVRAPAALLRDRTGGNPFFLREVWEDLERHGGISAISARERVPASIGDTLSGRVAQLERDVRAVIELAAVLGDSFDIATVVAAGGADRSRAMSFVDAATAAGLIEAAELEGGRYSFVHALTRKAVLDRMSGSRRTRLHAQVAEALERKLPDAALVPRLAHHYLAAHLLGFHEKALHYCLQAGKLSERSLAFEDAGAWFERAASLPECDPAVRDKALLEAGSNYTRACQFPRARDIYERLCASTDPLVRLAAAVGLEDATWRPGVLGSRAANLLWSALDDCGLDERDPSYVLALTSLGRALALAGEPARARQVGGRALDLARNVGDEAAVMRAVTASMWHGTGPGLAQTQLARTAEVQKVAREQHDYESLAAAANFRATVSYLIGRPDELKEAITDSRRSIQATGLPYLRHVYCCLCHAEAFLRGDFHGAEDWAEEVLRLNVPFDDDMADGPHAVQMFMVRRETGALSRFRALFDGAEPLTGRWVPGLLALYTELGISPGVRRALDLLLAQDLDARTEGAQWPMELAFMVEGALSLEDADALAALRPRLAEYEGMNLVCGTLIATFGSTDRYLGRVAACLGEHESAERSFAAALDMDRRTRSVVHTAETLAHYALFSARIDQRDRARDLARKARELAEPIGQLRVQRVLDGLDPVAGPDGLTGREVEVLRLLASGLSNHEIGTRLHISANTAANHVRSILMKIGAANRTQAAIYGAQHQLV